MENLRDKMTKAINSVPTLRLYRQDVEDWDGIAEACARVAEEEIAKAFDAGERFANECFCGECDYCLLNSEKSPDKDKYLKSLK